MNFHILLVHFPIALLTLYAAMEVLRFSFFTRHSWWDATKRFVLWVGAGALIPTMLAGYAVREPYARALPELLNAHMTFATLTAAVFLVLAIAYAIVAAHAATHPLYARLSSCTPWLVRQKHAVAAVIARPPVAPLLAALGFLFLFITGALGGALAHGADVDPFVSFVYSLIVR